jgi:predicted Zn-dependent peptidase
MLQHMLSHGEPMPASINATPVCFTLANGLHVSAMHAAASSQAAVFLRVAAGSHDEPAAYPGLAHFLEHLLFLGGAGFPDEQRLMPFVQGCGGQLNASTQARHTDYFFELPAALLEDGLARLLDMLTAPELAVAAQLREREVLHAEFLARAQDADTLCEAALAHALARHPLADFHAGQRASLSVETALFQQALQDFHRRFYRAGQMSLSLCGPQSPDVLRALARRYGGQLRSGTVLPAQRLAPPLLPLVARNLRLQLPDGPPRLWLGFALSGQAPALERAMDFLGQLLGAAGPGGLLDYLGEQGYCDELRLRTLYQHDEQVLLVVEFELADEQPASLAAIESALFSWLAGVAEADPWRELGEHYASGVSRRLSNMAPLQQVRAWQRGLTDTHAPTLTLDPPGVAALRLLLDQLRAEHLIRLLVSTGEVRERVAAAGFNVALRVEPLAPCQPLERAWRLGSETDFFKIAPLPSGLPLARMPLLCLPRLTPGESSEANTLAGPGIYSTQSKPKKHKELKAQQALEQAAIFLRWRLPPGLPVAGFFAALQRALRATLDAAQKLGVELSFSVQGRDWQLALLGPGVCLPAVLAASIEQLLNPAPDACAQGLRLAQGQRQRRAGQMPLRQLLECLPEYLADSLPGACGTYTSAEGCAAAGCDIDSRCDVSPGAQPENPSAKQFANHTEHQPAAMLAQGAEHQAQGNQQPSEHQCAAMLAQGSATPVTPERVAESWRQTSWDGLTLGLACTERQAVQAVLARLPGVPVSEGLPSAPVAAGCHWRQVPMASNEAAVLMFYPLPDRQPATDAAWQVLARGLESGFFQRLRSELQLGYGVFSGFRQMGEQAGLLFAVQSPSASVAQLLSHIDDFLQAQRAVWQALPAARLDALRQGLLTQWARQDVPSQARRAWQIRQSGHSVEYAARLGEALRDLTQAELHAQYQALLAPHSCWVLANAEKPDPHWN